MAPRDTRGGGGEAPSRETGVVPLPWMAACGDRGGALEAPDDGEDDQGGAAACGHVERVPVLLYRQARRSWMVRTRVQAATVSGGLVALDVDLLLSDWLVWLALDLRGRLEAL